MTPSLAELLFLRLNMKLAEKSILFRTFFETLLRRCECENSMEALGTRQI
jgi:hypothetical protein